MSCCICCDNPKYQAINRCVSASFFWLACSAMQCSVQPKGQLEVLLLLLLWDLSCRICARMPACLSLSLYTTLLVGSIRFVLSLTRSVDCHWTMHCLLEGGCCGGYCLMFVLACSLAATIISTISLSLCWIERASNTIHPAKLARQEALTHTTCTPAIFVPSIVFCFFSFPRAFAALCRLPFVLPCHLCRLL
jgi:hypothetical protein